MFFNIEISDWNLLTTVRNFPLVDRIYFFINTCFSWVDEVDVRFTLLTNSWRSWRILHTVDEVDEIDEIDEVDEVDEVDKVDEVDEIYVIYEINIFSSYFWIKIKCSCINKVFKIIQNSVSSFFFKNKNKWQLKNIVTSSQYCTDRPQCRNGPLFFKKKIKCTFDIYIHKYVRLYAGIPLFFLAKK